MQIRPAAAGGPRPVAVPPPGIVIHDCFEPPARPAIIAFIWGGKTRPVPQLPYGRDAA
jgi:hypothetical protein